MHTTSEANHDLPAHNVPRLVEALQPVMILSESPLFSYDDEHHFCGIDRSAYRCVEIFARFNPAQIHEDCAWVRTRSEPLVDTSRFLRAIFATITDKNVGHLS